MAGSKDPRSGDTERAKLQAEADKLAHENERMTARLKAVEEKIGRITKRPTLGDKLKAALLSGKNDPLTKLATERDQLMQALGENRKQQEAVAGRLAPQPKVTFAEEVQTLGPKNTVPSQTEPPKPIDGRSRRDSLSGEDLEKPKISQAYEEIELRSSAPSLSQTEDPLRQDVPDGYKPESRTRRFTPSQQEDESPLRQDVSRGYLPDEQLQSEGNDEVNMSSGTTTISREENTLNSPSRVSKGYVDAEQPSGSTTVTQKENPLRSESRTGYIDGNDTPTVRGDSLEPVHVDTYAVTNENSKNADLEQYITPTEAQKSYTEVELGSSKQEVDDLSGEPSLGVKGPKLKGDPNFKMKSLEKEFAEGEKNARSTKVKVGGQEVTVQEKEWLFNMANKQKREKGELEFTREEWDLDWARKQATTQYFNDEQRSSHEVHVKHGKLRQGSGTERMKQGDHIFVMDGKGQIYTAKDTELTSQMDHRGRKAHVHHSSFTAGEDVAGAGELQIGKDGTLKGVSDRSGHYKPREEQTKQTLEAIEQQGVSLDNVKFTMDRGEKRIGGMAKEFLQGQVTPEEQQHRQERIDSGKSVSDLSGTMEKTFKDRHNVVDQIKKEGTSVRDSLRKTGHLDMIEKAQQQGMGKVVDTPPKKGVGGLG